MREGRLDLEWQQFVCACMCVSVRETHTHAMAACTVNIVLLQKIHILAVPCVQKNVAVCVCARA